MKVNIIEFVGRAGVGKTYIAKNLYNDFENNDLKNIYLSTFDRRKISLKPSIDTLIILIKAIYIAFKLKPNSIGDFLGLFRRTYTILRRYKYYNKYIKKHKSSDINLNIFEDEGISQKCRTLNNKSKLLFEDIFKIMFNEIKLDNFEKDKINYYYVFVTAKSELIHERIYDRDKTRTIVTNESIIKGKEEIKQFSSNYDFVRFVLIDNNSSSIVKVLNELKSKILN